jgi:hypothetical protein
MGLRVPASGGWAAVCAAATLMTHMAMTHMALAQSPQPQFGPAQPVPLQSQPQVQPQMQEPAPPQAAPTKPEGFFDAFGRWWEKSTRDFKASVEEANAKWKRSVQDTNAKLKAGIDESNARWRELGRKTEQAAKDAAAAQKEAANDFRKAQQETTEALKNLHNLRMVDGRQVCAIAPNGSPDCQSAAETICRSKGFATGKSADITTARKCSARALLHRDESECRSETVVIKAACQ